MTKRREGITTVTEKRRSTNGNRAREELENSLRVMPREHYEEEGGTLVKRVTQLHILEAVQVLGKNQEAMGKFLLHLDDRIFEQNGYRAIIETTQETIEMVQKRVEQICSDIEVSCPNLPEIREIKEKINLHLAQEEKESLVERATTKEREKLISQGRDEAERRFKRITVVIGTTVGVVGITITIAAFIINHFL